MKTYLTALALAAALAQPAAAIPFSKLTTIYVGSGVYDDGGGSDAGVATSIHCSNVSGVSVQVRVLILGEIGGGRRLADPHLSAWGNPDVFNAQDLNLH